MTNKRWMIAGALVLMWALPVWLALGPRTPGARPAEKVLEAREWSLKKLDGSILDSASLRGRVIVFNFWATWCPPCRQEIPGLVALEREYGPRGLTVVGASLDQDGVEAVRKFVQAQSINYPVGLGDETLVDAFGGVESIPTTFIIDRGGRVVTRLVGFETKEVLEKAILALL